jgi:biopolymer transport protein ExbB/TolQ
MGGFDSAASGAMHQIVAACQLPVIILLLVGAAFTVLCLGSLVGEYFTEHRRFKVFLPTLIDELKNSADGSREVIKQSGLLLRQKQCLVELTRHPDITDTMRESMAVGLEYREQKRYDGIVKLTDVISRVAPMLGLLGTLIPLGPGIMALGRGEFSTLSEAIMVAFDTTAIGLIIGGICLIISAFRSRWYKEYMVNFDSAIECVLELERRDLERRDGLETKAVWPSIAATMAEAGGAAAVDKVGGADAAGGAGGAGGDAAPEAEASAAATPATADAGKKPKTSKRKVPKQAKAAVAVSEVEP